MISKMIKERRKLRGNGKIWMMILRKIKRRKKLGRRRSKKNRMKIIIPKMEKK